MNKGKAGYLIIASAIIWGLVMVGSAWVLKGTPYKDNVISIITGGVACHFIIIWLPLGKLFLEKKN
ncbi:MAG: hypothetical protein APR63_05760 [Desulfuromonas sp. SDB]|nr:MAG: hypothetical protein APR63_05760 [Desulfuromonas sp. SDB]